MSLIDYVHRIKLTSAGQKLANEIITNCDDMSIADFNGIMEASGFTIPKDFIVCTTGLGYYGDNPNIKELLRNIVDTLRSFGYQPFFYHYDIGSIPSSGYPEKIFNRHMTTEDIKKLELVPNHLLLDCAHITYYRACPSYRYLADERKTIVDIRQYGSDKTTAATINSLYPSFLNDFADVKFIRDFKFFTIEDHPSGPKVVTFITKGFEQRLQFSLLHKGQMSQVCDFSPTKDKYYYPYFDINLRFLSSQYTGQFASELFWSKPFQID